MQQLHILELNEKSLKVIIRTFVFKFIAKTQFEVLFAPFLAFLRIVESTWLVTY